MRATWKSWLCVAVAMLLASAVYAAKEMSVQVQKVGLRDKPSYLGKPTGYAVYGDRVTIADEKGDWFKVETPAGGEGWVHVSALTKKKVVLKAGGTDVGTAASGEELALAGKGFNADVEAEFKADNRDADFGWVDSAEGINYSSVELARFLREGGVEPKGGAE